jgi:hypothetical protein
MIQKLVIHLLIGCESQDVLFHSIRMIKRDQERRVQLKRTLIGVMIWLAFLSFRERTPLRIVISSSLRGSVPSRWNCKKVLSSAFRKLDYRSRIRSICDPHFIVLVILTCVPHQFPEPNPTVWRWDKRWGLSMSRTQQCIPSSLNTGVQLTHEIHHCQNERSAHSSDL